MKEFLPSAVVSLDSEMSASLARSESHAFFLFCCSEEENGIIEKYFEVNHIGSYLCDFRRA